MSLGQFTSRGAAAAFKMSRMFKGLGWAIGINSFLCSIYYNIIIAWILFYFFTSFRSKLQWSDCGNWWNTERCANPETLNYSNSTIFCNSIHYQINCTIPTLPPEEYFDNYVLHRSDSLDNLDLPSARFGIKFYLKPNWNKIRQFDVFADIAIFSVLGYMSFKTGLPIEQVAKAGPGLAFVAYPQALSIMPGGPFWAVIFFFMLLTLGLDTQFGLADVVIAGLLDTFKQLRQHKLFVSISYCIFCYLLALPICAPILMNEYAVNLSLIICGFLEFVVIDYIYGFNNFMEDIRMMLGKRPLEPYWFFTWCISDPIITLVLVFSSIIRFQPPTEGNYEYSAYANMLGWLMVCSSLIFIPCIMVYEFIKAWKVTNSLQYKVIEHMPHYLRMLTYARKPDTEWGPAKNENRYGRYKPKIEQSTSINQSNINDSDNNSTLKFKNMFRTRL
ncbi:unnamed protein product [Rotaria sordida]|uniref:Uncharacterized protein n=1 Tax=Rotaria sordida TaxID=392033 RepID=A0A815DPE7_9BILA|nr:unnamed protein product [Rotaria sordida]CAF1573217.1 unnamed protein product [Rotaria sordida]CAF4139806.1 unnamed protein product [Rotaria sordida]